MLLHYLEVFMAPHWFQEKIQTHKQFTRPFSHLYPQLSFPNTEFQPCFLSFQPRIINPPTWPSENQVNSYASSGLALKIISSRNLIWPPRLDPFLHVSTFLNPVDTADKLVMVSDPHRASHSGRKHKNSEQTHKYIWLSQVPLRTVMKKDNGEPGTYKGNEG